MSQIIDDATCRNFVLYAVGKYKRSTDTMKDMATLYRDYAGVETRQDELFYKVTTLLFSICIRYCIEQEQQNYLLCKIAIYPMFNGRILSNVELVGNLLDVLAQATAGMTNVLILSKFGTPDPRLLPLA